jgi:hypothetical protein
VSEYDSGEREVLANLAISVTAKLIEERDAAIRERDEAQASRLRVLDNIACYKTERDAAIARAEKAEREATGLCDQNVDLCRALESIEAEAARLREALREIADHDYYTMAGPPPPRRRRSPMAISEPLLPCPFCWSTTLRVITAGCPDMVQCVVCEANAWSSVWNRRADADCWVACAERPAVVGRYVVHQSNGEIQTAWYDGSDRHCWLDGMYVLDVTHWRPLPAPPPAAEKPEDK